MKTLVFIFIKAGMILIIFSCTLLGKDQAGLYPANKRMAPFPSSKPSAVALIMRSRVLEAKSYSEEKKFSTRYCFLVDMSIPSGKKRFFVFDFLNFLFLAKALLYIELWW